MEGVLHGIRVVEVAQWWFVPAAGAILADWGAEVLKIEHPESGDPARGLVTSGLMPNTGGVNFMIEQPNRGKRSVGLDLATEGGRELLLRLVERADVFLTNFLPDARRRLGIDVGDVRRANPRIVYVRGHGQGAKGPDAEKGGYDAASFWSRGGYRTRDGRWLFLNMLQPDRYWPDLCRRIGRPDLVEDARFRDGMSRFRNREECVRTLDAVFASKTLAEWKTALADAEGVWAPMHSPLELHDDPQARANGYLAEVAPEGSAPFTLVASPVQFEETTPALRPAPDLGQHTEEVLLELGLSWEDIAAYKEAKAIS